MDTRSDTTWDNTGPASWPELVIQRGFLRLTSPELTAIDLVATHGAPGSTGRYGPG